MIVETATEPLSGIRVVEWSGGDLATRFAARIFADFGAEVLQVPWDEVRPADVAARAIRRFYDSGKRVLPSGEAARLKAIEAAGVLLRSEHCVLPAGAIADDRRLVDTVVGALGATDGSSPWQADMLQICALSGVSAALGEPGRPPLHLPFSIPALQTGFHAAAATLVALRARDRDGLGQRVEVFAADVLTTYAAGMNLFIAGSGGRWSRRGFERHGPIYPSGFYPCRDGYVFMATQSRKPWQGFLRLMGNPEWAERDPALKDGVAIGWKRAGEVDVHFIPWLSQYTRAELVERAREIDDLILGPIHQIEETLEVEQLRVRDFWTGVEIDGRRIRLPGPGYRLSRTPCRIGEAPLPAPSPAASGRAAPEVSGAPPAHGALAGLRVLEFGWNWAGPMVGQILADYGAEVIKIETEGRQDFMRHWPHARGFFHNANRNKRSITIDITTPGGAELVRNLACRSDVVFDNFAAGVLARHGLAYEDLRRVKRELVVLSMALAGQTGPLRHLRGFATTATGFAGLEAAIGYSDLGSTGLPILGLGDLNAAIQAVVALLVALGHRDRTGEGQFIDVSQVEAATLLAADPLIRFQLSGDPHRPSGNAHPDFAPQGTYPAAGDDRWIAITVRNDREWQALVRVMQSPVWARAEELARAERRRKRRAEIDRAVSEWTRGFDRDRLAVILQEASIPAAPVLELEETLRHPWLSGLEACLRDNGPDGREWRIYRTPWNLRRTPGEIRSLAPALGADNDRVFREILGLEAEEIERLKAERIIA